MKRALALSLVMAAVTAGCGSGGTQPLSHTASSGTGSSPPHDPSAVLTEAVRTALEQNGRLSLYVLWHNTVPNWARQSSAGPALAGFRASAAGRRKAGIQIRSLSDHLRILSVRLDPSFVAAIAIVDDRQRVVPYRHGHQMGRPISFDERARVELHRVGQAPRFVVWQVSAAR